MACRVATRLLLVANLMFIQIGWAQSPTDDALLQRGSQALRVKDFQGAKQAFLLLVQHAPTADNYFELATAEANAGESAQAIAHMEKSITLGNHTAGAHYDLGILYMQTHQIDAAANQFRQAIALDPKYFPARDGLGVALMTSGHAAQAMAVIEKSMEIEPHEPHLWALLVSAQFEAGKSSKAVASTQAALQDVPNDPLLDVTLATICLRFHVVQRARELLEDADELMPQDPEVALLLARASLMAGEPVEALAVLRGMPPVGQKGIERLLLMGESHALLGDTEHANHELRMALNDSPDDPQCLTAYAWMQNFTGHYREALATLTKARAITPKAPGIRYGMALSYYFLGQYAEAEKSCDEALKLAPQYPAAYFVRGMARRKEKHFEAARNDFSKAVELAPMSAVFHREFAIALIDNGEAATAREQLDIALTLDPKDAESYFLRAKSMHSPEDKEKAIADLNRAVTLKPGYQDAYTELVRLYTVTGHPDMAAEVLARQKQVGLSSKPSDDASLLHTIPDSTP